MKGNSLKIKRLFFLYFLLLLGACKVVKIETDWSKDALSDRVKKVTQVSYEYINTKKKDDKWKKKYTNVTKYNKKGYKIEELEYDNNLKMTEKTTFQYKRGKLRTSSTDYFSDRADWNVSYKYKKSNLSEKTLRIKSGEIYARDLYTYDKCNRPKTFCRYDNLDKLERKKTFEYDEQGRCVEHTYFKYLNDFYTKFIYEYDTKGNKVEYRYKCRGDSCELKAKFIHVFDAKGNEIAAEIYDKEEKLLGTMKSQYDERGNCISEENYNTDGIYKKGEKYEFVYDNSGNWVVCVMYKNNELYYKVERTYEYFEE